MSNEERKTRCVTESHRLRLMTVNEMLLCISGTIATEEIINNPMTLKLYRLYQIFLYLMYIPLMTAQFLALYIYKNNLILTLDNIGALVLIFIAYGLHFTVDWQEARALLFKLETRSVLMNSGTQTNDTKLKIVEESKHRSRNVTITATFSMVVVSTIWICEPFLLKLVDNLAGDKKEEHGSNMGNFTTQAPIKIYPVVMWLPFDITTNPTYLVLYIIIVFDVAVIAAKIISNLSFIMSLFIYTSAQFGIVTASIQNICNEDNLEKLQHMSSNSVEEHDMTTNFDYQMSYQGKELLINILRQTKGTKSRSGFKSSDTTHSSAASVNGNEVHSGFYRGFNIFECLTDCAKLHQSAIKFFKEVDELTSTYFFLVQSAATIAVSFGLFQLSLNLGFGTNLKHALTSVYIILCGGITSWFGEDIRTQSLMVQGAAYNMGWYYHCTKLKRMLLILMTRAQIPCTISMGPVNKMTMEHFQELLNGSYTFFTLLLQFNE